MVRMIEEWPGATVELCNLASGPRSPQWLRGLADEWFQHFLEPAAMMELLKRKPEAGVELVRLIRRMGLDTARREFKGLKQGQHLEEIGDPGYVMEVLHTWPEAGVEIVRLASEIDPQWADRFAEVWLRHIHPRAVVELLHEMPDVAIEVLRLASESGGDREVRCLREVMRPRVILDILDRRPEVGVQLLRLMREFGRSGLMEQLGAELAETLFHPDMIYDLLHRIPEAAAELLLLAHEIGGRERLRGVNEEWFERSFPPSRAIELLRRRPDACIGMLDLARETDSRGWLRIFNEHLLETVTSTRHGESLLSSIPLGLAWRIKWAAQQTGNEVLLQRVEAALQGNGEEAVGDPGRLLFRRPTPAKIARGKTPKPVGPVGS